MVDNQYEEWRTLNSSRRYPFADDSLLVDTQNRRLPDNVFIDAMFHPVSLVGRLYLSSLSFSELSIQVSDDQGVVATAVIGEDLTAFNFYDNLGRMAGIMVPGPGFGLASGDFVFIQESSGLAQTCVAAQNYGCLNAVLLPDGTLLTGQIYWEGENGIRVSTEYLDSVPVIRFDALGVAEFPECLPLTPPVKCIKVSQTGAGGALMINRSSNIITLGTPYTLAAVCHREKGSRLPDADGNLPLNTDACDTPEVVPCEPPDGHEGSCDGQQYNQYFLWPLEGTVGVLRVQQDPIFDQASAAAYAESGNAINLPLRPKQGLKIFMKGAL